jgi:hypothetical protein
VEDLAAPVIFAENTLMAGSALTLPALAPSMEPVYVKPHAQMLLSDYRAWVLFKISTRNVFKECKNK